MPGDGGECRLGWHCGAWPSCWVQPFSVALIQRSRVAAPVMYGICLLACLGILASAVSTSFSSRVGHKRCDCRSGLPWTGAHFRIDALAAFFLVVVNLGGAGASLFAIGYGRHEVAPGRVLPFYPLFLAGMNLVVLADDAFSFLAAWEFMSLSSWALVVAHHHDPENTRAGYIYILMASFGTLALLLAFGLLAGGTGGYTFAEMRAGGGTLPAVVLILALLGAGSKAGLVPLHVWLPLAHPAAPSHVSALMSGVMTKVAVYGFIRIVFDLNGPPMWWWSVLVIASCRHHLRSGRAQRPDAARSEAPARLPHGREHRHHLSGAWPGAGVLRRMACRRPPRWH